MSSSLGFGTMPRLTDKNEIGTCLPPRPRMERVCARQSRATDVFGEPFWFAPDLTLIVQEFSSTPSCLRWARAAYERPSMVSFPGPCICRCSATRSKKWHATRRYRSSGLMWRMTWTGNRPASPGAVAAPAGASDVPRSWPCQPTGSPRASRPDLRGPSMVAEGQGVFHGVYEGTALVAAAGTHVLGSRGRCRSDWQHLHPGAGDRRGRGLCGRLATSAVLAGLAGIQSDRPQHPRRQRHGAASVPESRSASRVTASSTRRWRCP